LAQAGAVEIISEDRLTADELISKIEDLLGSKEKREALGLSLNQLAYPDSAKKLAQLLIDTVKSNK
jgi:UDP-N-acetylglucosamine:LPS N-acetylglucosamine transferase